MRDLTERALDTATSLGASYADVRIVRRHEELIAIKTGRVEGVASERRPVTEAEMRSADELLIASAGGGIRAVTTLDGRRVGGGVPGPVYRRIYAAFKATQREFSAELPA